MGLSKPTDPIIVTASPGVNGAKAYSLTHFDTTTELASGVMVVPGYTYTTVYSIRLPDLLVGDILHFTSQCEVTNDTGHNIMAAQYTQLRSDKSTLKVTAACGTNIDPSRHHHVIQTHRQYKIQSDMTNVYLELVVYAAGFDGQKSGILTVEKGYGHLDCILIR